MRRLYLGFLLLFPLLSPAVEQVPEKHCRYANIVKFPVKDDDGKILAEGSINGKPAAMLTDTGADMTGVMQSKAEELGLKLQHTDLIAVGVGGEAPVYVAMLDDIIIGNLGWQHKLLTVIGDNGKRAPFDVLVGANLLFAHDLEIFLTNKEVKFFKPTDCQDAFLAYWDKQASFIPLNDESAEVPNPVIEVMLNGQRLRAVVDSGAQVSLINLAAARRAGVTPDSPGVVEDGTGVGVGAHNNKMWLAPFDSFSIGDETIKHPKINIQDLYHSALTDNNWMHEDAMLHEEPDMLLGADFLRSHRLLFALSQHRLYFSYLGGTVFGPEKKIAATDEAPASH